MCPVLGLLPCRVRSRRSTDRQTQPLSLPLLARTRAVVHVFVCACVAFLCRVVVLSGEKRRERWVFGSLWRGVAGATVDFQNTHTL